MPDERIAKNDILNHEDGLYRLMMKAKTMPKRPQYERDGDDLHYKICEQTTDAQKLKRLVEEVFDTQVALAKHLKCNVQLIKDTIHRNSDSADWEDYKAGTNLWLSWLCWRLLSVMANKGYCTPAKASRFGVKTPEAYVELHETIQRLLKTPAAWLGNLSQDLASMCQLMDVDYPGENC